MLTTIQALSEIRLCCEEQRAIPEDLQPWLGDAIGKFLDKNCCDLDEAFGLRRERGGVPWWLERGIRERDKALREFAVTQFGSQEISAQARLIEEMARRYETTSWTRDAAKSTMPRHYSGTPRQYLWRAFRSGARMPISARHLRNILRNDISPCNAIEVTKKCAV